MQPEPAAQPAPIVKKEMEATNSTKAKSQGLQFLGISVNEFQYNIKKHLLNRGFSEYSGEFTGKFWILSGNSLAKVSFGLGKIIVRFEMLHIDLQHRRMPSELLRGLRVFRNLLC